MVAKFLAGEVTQVKESIPWVRCASDNVYRKVVGPMVGICTKLKFSFFLLFRKKKKTIVWPFIRKRCVKQIEKYEQRK